MGKNRLKKKRSPKPYGGRKASGSSMATSSHPCGRTATFPPPWSLNSERHPIVIYASMQGENEQNRRRILNQKNYNAPYLK